jgi:2-aminoethylphosphonate transport system substrate-binding protein
MNYEDALSTYPNLKIWFPQGPDGKPNTFALPYDVGLVKNAPNGSAGQKLIDFMLSKQSQSIVASAGGGLPVRDDVHPTDATYRALAALLSGVTIFTPDWSDIESNLRKYVTDWQNATGTV